MPFTTTDIATEVRGRLGDPSDAELPNVQLSRALAAALREFSRFRKRDTPHNLALTQSVTDYALPLGTTDVKGILLLPPASRLTLPLVAMLDPSVFLMQLSGSEEWDLRSVARYLGLLYIDNYVVDATVIQGKAANGDTPAVAPVLRLHPAPDMDAVCLLVIQKPLTLEDLDDEEQEHIITYMMGDCLEYIGRKRSKSVRQVPTAAGNLKLDDGKDLREEGCELKKNMRRLLGQGATVIDVG